MKKKKEKKNCLLYKQKMFNKKKKQITSYFICSYLKYIEITLKQINKEHIKISVCLNS
jgi:hypothetical protein